MYLVSHQVIDSNKFHTDLCKDPNFTKSNYHINMCILYINMQKIILISVQSHGECEPTTLCSYSKF